ncbi:MAG: ATP-binding protein [Lachnospiraceae bacterium]|nr:ATP-binding protein [Lachnospiraceae bacterium]
MLVELRVKNCYIFSEEIVFSMKADMTNKKLAANVHRGAGCDVLKTACIYGPNNVGKTCLIKCFKGLKQILNNEPTSLNSNIFLDDGTCSLGVTFTDGDRVFTYDFSYNEEKKEFPKEKFAELISRKSEDGLQSENGRRNEDGRQSKDIRRSEDIRQNEDGWKSGDGRQSEDSRRSEGGRQSEDSRQNEDNGFHEKVYWYRDTAAGVYEYEDDMLVRMMPILSRRSLLIHQVDTSSFPLLDEMKQRILKMASEIEVISMVNIPMQKTIDLLKNKNEMQDKVVQFIKNADLDMDSISYVEPEDIPWKDTYENGVHSDEEVLDQPDRGFDSMRLVSVYKGVPVPSLLFDSTGTKKIAALASYIIEALERGQTLIIDELDSGIHFKLTRAMVAMFNNELNQTAQMIFSVHDTQLLDCRRLLRPEQIWFIHKDREGVYVYSLADVDESKNTRQEDVQERYRRGDLGALPNPQLIDTLLQMSDAGRTG